MGAAPCRRKAVSICLLPPVNGGYCIDDRRLPSQTHHIDTFQPRRLLYDQSAAHERGFLHVLCIQLCLHNHHVDVLQDGRVVVANNGSDHGPGRHLLRQLHDLWRLRATSTLHAQLAEVGGIYQSDRLYIRKLDDERGMSLASDLTRRTEASSSSAKYTSHARTTFRAVLPTNQWILANAYAR